MLRSWTERPLADLLGAHGVSETTEALFPHNGWSGASLTRLVRARDQQAFILKRTSWAVDWIARSTRDHALREGFVASMPLPVPEPLVAPYYGAAADGTSVAILMPDLSDRLLGWEGLPGSPGTPLATVDILLNAVARLHAMPWPMATRTDAPFVWPSVPLRERLLLLSPRSAHRLAGDGLGAGEIFVRGWDAFNRLATTAAVELINALDRDPRPLLNALGALPPTTLHGDLKLANVALLEDDRVALIDWQMTALAPVAVELGWALVTNSSLLPIQPDDLLDRYLAALQVVAGTPVGTLRPFEPTQRFDTDILEAALGSGAGDAVFRSSEATLGDWDRQRDLIWIIGLLLRGWRKGSDAEAGATLASGVAATEDLAWWCERAVEAATRSLIQPAA